MAVECLIGVDIGTGACKTVIIDIEGRVLGRAIEEYPTDYPAPGWAEQDPQHWYRAFCSTVRRAMADASVPSEAVRGISFDGATHTVVLMDSRQQIVRRPILWTDKRTGPQVERIRRQLGDRVAALTFNVPGCAWTLAHLLWIREQDPSSWERTARILPAKDYVRYRVTGEMVTDFVDATGTMLLDMGSFTWSNELCEFLGVTQEMLPPLVSPNEIVGRVTSRVAQETGLVPGTPVVAGASDTAVEVFGAGAMRPGDFTVKLGTSGRICVVSDRAHVSPMLVTYPHLVRGLWYPGTGTGACATSYRWLRDVFCVAEERLSEDLDGGVSAFQIMDMQAATCPPGSEGLVFHPYLLGEGAPYNDPALRGDFLGLTIRHGRRHFMRSVLEGVAFSLRDCVNTIHDIGIPMERGRLIGGGSRSDLWSQIVSDVLGMEFDRMNASDAAFGAAMLAGVGIGVFGSLEEAAALCVRVRDHIMPDTGRMETYAKLFDIYKESAHALFEVNHRLSAKR